MLGTASLQHSYLMNEIESFKLFNLDENVKQRILVNQSDC
jgi:hypothetical protein